ncbi:histidine kinase [Adhaeribacter arboris]|uniref:histidine kinase n=1 Tax=Adhaeribacter arboris TaxID=2072846 RepID=A0A2T2YLE5_9BACT|nr:ATP-binding protein [Adhaeribacter arboris]PSR56334.1 histidine kinase [Adhaeribacter arboris]
MTLRTKFILFAVLIHAVMALIAARLLTTDKIWFVGTEALIIVSIIVTVNIYRSFVRPLDLVSAGIESIRSKDFTVKFLPVGQREVDQLVEVYNSMIDQLRLERTLQAEKHFLLEQLLLASPSGIILLDFDGNIENINPSASQWLQVSLADIKGKPLWVLPNQWGTDLADLTQGEPKVFNVNGIRLFKAQKAHFVDRGFPHYFILIEELTEELVRQEKVAYEKIIRMMSHEVNNSIGAINSILQSFKFYTPQLETELQSDYENALQVCIERNTQLANFMGKFAGLVRLPLPQKQTLDLHALLHHAYYLLRTAAENRNIAWVWDLAAEPIYIQADEQQLEQIIINIIKNAFEAMEQDGRLTIKTLAQPPTLLIEDNGPGIPPEVRQQLFSPFFSTKKNGQGIGLMLIRDILMNHGFPFSLETIADHRTVFNIQFK